MIVAARSSTPTTRPFFSRKDVARLLDVSTEIVRANERRLGLDIARCDINPRVVRYHGPIALQQLRLRGKLPIAFYTN